MSEAGPGALLTTTGSGLVVSPPDGQLSSDKAQLLGPMPDPDAESGRAIDDAFLPPADLCRQFWANDAYGRVVLDGEGTILWLNATAAAMTGRSIAEVRGHNMVEFIAAEDLDVAIEAVAEIQDELSEQKRACRWFSASPAPTAR